ncbi:MAG: ABC transporter ATP-binding protein [Polyangiaceae bacterium]
MSPAPLIEVEGLCKAYGAVRAVRDVAFSVGRGEVVGFLGPNGAGKSTTLRMLVGYLAPSAGRVRVNGHDVVEEPLLARRALGYMPESAPLYPEMRVAEYLRFRVELKGVARRQRQRQVDRAAEKAGVADVRSVLIQQLSRGYRQRVALADALLGDPPLLILDEPTAGLDPNQIKSVRDLIVGLGQEHTVLLSTHILSEVESVCSRALVIDQGVLVAQGAIDELTRRRGARRALLVVSDAEQRARGLLEQHPALSAVERVHAGAEHGPRAVYRLSFAGDDEPLAELIAELVRAGVAVDEARLERTSLEDVFRRLTAEHS